MSRKKRKPEKVRYLPGARWLDVLRGRPVTQAERDREERRNTGKVAYRCRDCPFAYRLARRGGTLRCVRCGGVLDPVV